MADGVKSVVRYKNPGKNSTYNPYSFVTEKKAKQMKNEYKEGKAYRAKLAAAATPATPGTPTMPAPPSTAPILGGAPTAPVASAAPGKGTTPWEAGGKGTTPWTGTPGTVPPGPPQPDTSVPGWWINSAITNPSTEDAKFANIANALLPTLAPEDQRTLATYLAQNYKDVYGGYANTKFDDAPTEITDDVRNKFLSPQRAQVAISLLDKMKQASGVQDMGAGYDYLKNAVNLINQFTTGGVMTRERYQQFTNAVGNLNKNAGQGLSAYANLGQLFNLPQFTAGPLISNTANNKLFS